MYQNAPRKFCRRHPLIPMHRRWKGNTSTNHHHWLTHEICMSHVTGISTAIESVSVSKGVAFKHKNRNVTWTSFPSPAVRNDSSKCTQTQNFHQNSIAVSVTLHIKVSNGNPIIAFRTPIKTLLLLYLTFDNSTKEIALCDLVNHKTDFTGIPNIKVMSVSVLSTYNSYSTKELCTSPVII